MLEYLSKKFSINKENMSESIFSEKKKYAKAIKEYYHLNTKNKAIGLILLNDESSIDFLLDGLEVLSCDFVIKTKTEFAQKLNVVASSDIKKDLLLGFDFVVSDNEVEWLWEYFKLWVVPILPSNNHLSGILREFDPLQSEGNSFLYQDANKWSMYYALIRYLENYKFPYDNRNLVKNVVSI